ncbi:MAG: hypothetical protein ACLTDF_04170 [Coprococcus sp.]
MIFTWLKYGKPDVSMCLNASLAGLVAITNHDPVDAFGLKSSVTRTSRSIRSMAL